MKKLIVYTDGGSRNNPGPAGIGIVIYNKDREVLAKHKEYIGVATNNQAEYSALIKALEITKDMEADAVDCYLDSELVVKQLKGEYRVKNAGVKELYDKVISLIGGRNISFCHVPRAENKLADKLVNEALDQASGDKSS
jgi:ribonuclease HI